MLIFLISYLSRSLADRWGTTVDFTTTAVDFTTTTADFTGAPLYIIQPQMLISPLIRFDVFERDIFAEQEGLPEHEISVCFSGCLGTAVHILGNAALQDGSVCFKKM